MRIHRLLSVSRVNGPGSRFVVWVQGCSRQCSGCFNPATHDHRGGYELEVSEIVRQIPLTEVIGITVSGGEPFEQPEELEALLEKTRQMGLNRLVYSGFTHEELKEQGNRIVERCLPLIDILIDGAYEKEIPAKMPWTGSGNQRVIELRNGQVQNILEEGELEASGIFDGELIIDSAGGITATGIMDSGKLAEEH
ncbi:MAG: radical SAM protein [Treponema sp.]|jgi:anaerobic ribonucleoside-triphosphate reductase activating protein|nr:radical SAM protein [Treponema sp.]